VAEWTGDNAGKDKQGVRVPIERAYKIAQHTWKGRHKQEWSIYDLQLSTTRQTKLRKWSESGNTELFHTQAAGDSTSAISTARCPRQ
jgi:hypothetical protein